MYICIFFFHCSCIPSVILFFLFTSKKSCIQFVIHFHRKHPPSVLTEYSVFRSLCFLLVVIVTRECLLSFIGFAYDPGLANDGHSNLVFVFSYCGAFPFFQSFILVLNFNSCCSLCFSHLSYSLRNAAISIPWVSSYNMVFTGRLLNSIMVSQVIPELTSSGLPKQFSPVKTALGKNKNADIEIPYSHLQISWGQGILSHLWLLPRPGTNQSFVR